MKSVLKALVLAGAFVGATAISAAAATLSLAGTGYTQNYVLPAVIVGPGPGGYNLASGGGGTIDYLTGAAKNASNGLKLNGPGILQYTYIGSEAGNVNFSLGQGAAFTEASTVNSSLAPFLFAGGFLDFTFGTSSPTKAVATIANNGGATRGPGVTAKLSSFAIGYKILDGGKSAFIYFDDIASGDRDFDDFVVRVSVSAVPVPAAGFLLLGALGGLAALRRRKTA